MDFFLKSDTYASFWFNSPSTPDGDFSSLWSGACGWWSTPFIGILYISNEPRFFTEVSLSWGLLRFPSLEFPSSSDSGRPQGTSPSVSGIGEVFKGLSGWLETERAFEEISCFILMWLSFDGMQTLERKRGASKFVNQNWEPRWIDYPRACPIFK